MKAISLPGLRLSVKRQEGARLHGAFKATARQVKSLPPDAGAGPVILRWLAALPLPGQAGAPQRREKSGIFSFRAPRCRQKRPAQDKVTPAGFLIARPG